MVKNLKVKPNEIKNKIQLKAVDLSSRHSNLCLEWSTGVGKTRAAALIVQKIIKENPEAKGFLVCKESTHLKNWIVDIKKFSLDSILDNMSNFLYASLHKHNKSIVDFIILDECHALTWKRVIQLRKIIQSNKTKVILLSATIPDEKKYLIERLLGTQVFYAKITLKKAFELKLLPEPKIIVHKVELEDNPGDLYDIEIKKGRTIKVTQVKFYKLITKRMEYYLNLSEDTELKQDLRRNCKNKYLNLGTQRKKFLSIVKTKKAKELVERFRASKSRFICFSGTIDQSLELGALSAINSKNKKGINQELIDCFNREDCVELFVVKMLREGVNLSNIEKGIIIQLDSTVGSFYQMLGRCLRHEFPEMHIIVVKNTKDEQYFANSIKDFDKKYIRYE